MGSDGGPLKEAFLHFDSGLSSRRRPWGTAQQIPPVAGGGTPTARSKRGPRVFVTATPIVPRETESKDSGADQLPALQPLEELGMPSRCAAGNRLIRLSLLAVTKGRALKAPGYLLYCPTLPKCKSGQTNHLKSGQRTGGARQVKRWSRGQGPRLPRVCSWQVGTTGSVAPR